MLPPQSPNRCAPLSHPQQLLRDASLLLQLPADLFRLIWERLAPTSSRDRREIGNRDQLGLRLACKAAMHASTALITSFACKMEPKPAWEETLQNALEQLSRFPTAAALSKLSWSLDAVGAPPHAPGLLPSFLLQAASRLATVRVVDLSGVALTYGEASSLADFCPQLQRIDLHAAVVGPAFTPLSRLTSLSSLSACYIWAPEGSACVGQSLRHLAHLTQLQLETYPEEDDTHADPEPDLCLQDILPHVGGLRCLRQLNLSLSPAGRLQGLTDHSALYGHLGSLTLLTSLRLCGEVGARLTGADIASFARMSCLASLTLSSTLDASAIALLAGLPNLTELAAHAVDPSHDVSAVACTWRDLYLTRYPAFHQVAWLPLSGVGLHCDDFAPWLCGWLSSTLSPTGDASTLLPLLRRAAQVLLDKAPANIGVHLSWDAPPLSPYPHPLLASLAPLRDKPGLALRLGEHWSVSAEVVQQVADCFPSLFGLQVDEVSLDFSLATFASFVGCTLPNLPNLLIGRCPGEALLEPVCVADRGSLREVARVRKRVQKPLEVVVGGVEWDDRFCLTSLTL